MSYSVFWTREKIQKLKSLYESGLSMREVGEHFGRSVWSINSVMNRKQLVRRPASQTKTTQFQKSPLSFTPKLSLNESEKNLKIAGLMLYWAEGAKKNTKRVDFANSDPDMIMIFLRFLRKIYQVDESKFRVYLYTYNSLPTNQLLTYWSKLTNIPVSQFSKPYIRTKSELKHDKMQYGLIHIRYSDIRLFRIIMGEIKDYIKS